MSVHPLAKGSTFVANFVQDISKHLQPLYLCERAGGPFQIYPWSSGIERPYGRAPKVAKGRGYGIGQSSLESIYVLNESLYYCFIMYHSAEFSLAASCLTNLPAPRLAK